MGAWVPVSQLAEEEVAAYRQLEEERIAEVLDDLVETCHSQKVEHLLPFQILFFFCHRLCIDSQPVNVDMSLFSSL